MSERDPRVNPRAGDVLQRGDEVATVLDGNAERARALVAVIRGGRR